MRKVFADAAKEGLKAGLVKQKDLKAQVDAHAMEDGHDHGLKGRKSKAKLGVTCPEVPSHKLPTKITQLAVFCVTWSVLMRHPGAMVSSNFRTTLMHWLHFADKQQPFFDEHCTRWRRGCAPTRC